MKRVLTVAFAAIAYLWFLADTLWGIAFVADVPAPTAIDHGRQGSAAVAAVVMIDHFDFVGLRQAASRPGDYRPPTFRERWLYAWVRHPLMLGLLIAFWVTPSMTGGHLLFAIASTGYIAVGVYFEERGLRRHLGEAYRDYARRTPAIVPGLRRAGVDRTTGDTAGCAPARP